MSESIPAVRVQEHPTFDWRESLWAANGWLLFLLFPVASVLLADIDAWRKVVGYVLIALFALTHVLAYMAMAVREAEAMDQQLEAPRFIGPQSPTPYFAVMIAMSAVAITVVGPGLLGFLPFVVVFGIFNYRWAIAAAIVVACVVACVLVPIAFDLFPDLLFFVIIVVSTAAGASFTRISEETSEERSALRTSLAVSDERNRVARDVHDVLGHSLTAVILKTQVCAKLLERVNPDDTEQRAVLEQVRAELDELDTVSRRAMAEIRSTVGGLRVANLADELAAARTVLADAGVELTVRGDTNGTSEQHRTTLAWVVRESVTNVVRHARASSCLIEFPTDDKRLLMRITDDGIGPNGSSPGRLGEGSFVEGNGMRGMRERVADAGVEINVGAGPDHGTRIEVRG